MSITSPSQRSDDSPKSGKERVLDSALHLFSRYGFSLITTDKIAREADVSQAYVVRAFGGKEALIRTVCGESARRVQELFRNMIPLSDDNRGEQFRKRFYQMAFESDDMRLLAQLFVSGDEALSKLAREGFSDVAHLLHDELGVAAEETRQILARGMLATTLASLDYERPADPLIEYLITGMAVNGESL